VTYNVAVLKGMLFNNNERVTKNIRAEVERRKLSEPNAEIACLIYEKFSDEELEAMGLWGVITMHDPIKDSGGDPVFLGILRLGLGRWLAPCSAGPDVWWFCVFGFAFVVSQVSTQV
jgi:hypothetical protein